MFCGVDSSPTPPTSPSNTSTSPQHGSPDSDKFYPELYQPPSPASSPTSDSSTQSGGGSESLLTALQRHTVDWSKPPGCIKGGPEYFVLWDSKLPKTPSLSETQDEDSQTVNLPPSPALSQDSQFTYSQGEVDTGSDEYDGWIRFGFIRAVKTAVYHLLYHAINKYMHDKWNGCSMGRPSLTDHERWEHLEEGLFESNYYRVMQVLYNARFIEAIQLFLAARDIHQDSGTVTAVAQAYLYELTLVKKVHDPINKVYDQVIHESPEFRDQLLAASQYWRGC